ncbi:MAG: hypothetical protein QM632_01785 [Micrococcaceae bacterium]
MMNTQKQLSRRQITKGAAWSVPAIATAIAVPAMAASPIECTTANTVSDLSILTYNIQIVADSSTSYLVITNNSSTQCFSATALYGWTGLWSFPLTSQGTQTIAGGSGSRVVSGGSVRIRWVIGAVAIAGNDQLVLPIVSTSSGTYTYLYGPGTDEQSRDFTFSSTTTYTATSAIAADGNITITQHRA